MAVVPLWIQTHREDLPAPDDADLMASARSVLDAPNGFVYFEAAARAVRGLRDADEQLRAMRERRTWQPELLADLERQNVEALRELELGLASESVSVPSDLLGVEETAELSGRLFEVLQLVKLVVTEAQRFERLKDRDRAFERALFGLRVGHKLMSVRNSDLLIAMIAVACQGISLSEIERLVGTAPLTVAKSRDLVAQIDSYGIPPAAWRAAWAGEYQRLRTTLLDAWAQDRNDRLMLEDELAHRLHGTSWGWLRWVPEDYLLQPNRTLTWLAAYYREQQQISQLDCRAAFSTYASTEIDLARLTRILLAPNPTGEMIARIITPNPHTFDRSRCSNDSRAGMVQLAVAIAAYAHAEGELPDRLDPLVPTYLDAIPLDRFDGEPLRYSKEKAIVYSIGEDLVDSGGSDPPSQSNRSEPTIRVAL